MATLKLKANVTIDGKSLSKGATVEVADELAREIVAAKLATVTEGSLPTKAEAEQKEAEDIVAQATQDAEKVAQDAADEATKVVAKAQEDAQAVLDKANADAAKIVEDAKAEAAKVVEAAKRPADTAPAPSAKK